MHGPLRFMRDLFMPRIVNASPTGFYKPIPITGDDNRPNAFETLEQPPPMELAGGPAASGYLQPLSPGPGPGTFGTIFAQQAFDAHVPFGDMGSAVSTDAGLLQTFDFIGGGPLFVSPDSAPEQELV